MPVFWAISLESGKELKEALHIHHKYSRYFYLESGKELKVEYLVFLGVPEELRLPLESGKELKDLDYLVKSFELLVGWNPERN